MHTTLSFTVVRKDVRERVEFGEKFKGCDEAKGESGGYLAKNYMKE